MITDPQDTLAFHQSRVLSQHIDRSQVPCSRVAKALIKFSAASHSDAVPESEALYFYGMNAGVALISERRAPLEPLSKWEHSFVNSYYTLTAEKATRALNYLLRICIRESRHNKSFSTSLPKVGELCGENVQNWFAKTKGGEDGIMKLFENDPPNAAIGDFCKAMQWMFYHSNWAGGYGGKKWGMVTDCLVDYVTGKFSAEIMLDTIWTLSHNNGPIFNKGYLYSMYSGALIRLLDVQRSGQVPEAVLYDTTISAFADPKLKKLMDEVAGEFPNKVGSYVDWGTVEALGSVHKYPKEKAKQQAQYGLSPAAQAAKAAADAKAKAEAEKAAQQAAEHALNWFQVMPGMEVEKVKIARAA